MPRLTAALALVAALIFAAPAGAHKVDPHYLTKVDTITPTTPGITVSVINRSDQLLLKNHSGKEVIIGDYNGYPYGRIEPDGTVSVNRNSPAYYLNQDAYGTATVPKGVTGKGAPDWHVLDKTSGFQWHDHRMHWMDPKNRPQQVTDTSKKTKIFDWKIPLTIGGQKGQIAGTLFWTPEPGAPVGFMIVASVLLIGLCAFALVARRRRDRADADAAESEAPKPAAEAW